MHLPPEIVYPIDAQDKSHSHKFQAYGPGFSLTGGKNCSHSK